MGLRLKFNLVMITVFLVGLGVTAAVLTVLVGAFIFAADFSVPAGYQSALARHLAKKQAIFYGAYW